MIATPLTDLGSAKYLGFPGGLYPRGKNSPPSAYKKAGVAVGATVQPLDKDGNPSNSGKIGMPCIGMSNTSYEFSELIRLVDADARKNPSLVMIDTGRDGADATQLIAASGDYWLYVDRQLDRCEVSAAQIQVIWLKTALAHESLVFPENAQLLQQALRSIVGILTTKFPHLKLVYVSSRIYGGYSQTDLSPEPIAFESGFAVKWLIEERINNPSAGNSRPWVSWGPYLWADGLTPRSDGLIWESSDFKPDGVHPSAQGALKAATMLFKFFQKDTAARPWFFSRTT